MSAEIKTVEQQIVEDIHFEYFEVADGWTIPKTPSNSRTFRVNRKVYAWKIRRDRSLCTSRAEKQLGNPVHIQGFALLSDIRTTKASGFQNMVPICNSSFFALTPKMLERLTSWGGAGLFSRFETRCKKPFDMLKSDRAKLYRWDNTSLCTLAGKILVR